MTTNLVITFSLILCGLSTFVISSTQKFRFGKVIFEKMDEIFINRDSNDVSEKWFQQNLDHFDPQTLNSWKQRYFTSSKYSQPDGPIFLEIGGEGPINLKKFKDSYMADNLAREFKAYAIQLEHRFYGQSQPFKNWSTKNLAYLTSEQALADLANFINTMSQKEEFRKRKWIVFGGSYSGSLSAWMRLKYPHLVAGSIASSAPVQAQLDFPEYLQVVEQSLGPKCSKEVRNSFSSLRNWIKSDGSPTLIKLFNLCDFDVKSKKTVTNFVSTVLDSFCGTVQYNEDNREGNNVTIDTVCEIMTSDYGKNNQLDGIKKLSEVFKLIYKQKECVNISYASQVEEIRNQTIDFQKAGRQWYYQTCNEFGYYQTTDSKSPFPIDSLDLDYFTDLCVEAFGSKFTKDYIIKAIERTNTIYGGRNLKADKVFLINGSIDPWHALGLTNYHYLNTTSDFIEGTAHCADMYPAREEDKPDLVKARKLISERIKVFLQ